MESALTQVAMERALRVRITSNVLDESKGENADTKVSLPVPNSYPSTSAPAGSSDAQAGVDDADTETEVEVDGDNATVTEVSTLINESTEETKADSEGGQVKKQSANLIGRINNLITADMSSVVSAQNALSLR